MWESSNIGPSSVIHFSEKDANCTSYCQDQATETELTSVMTVVSLLFKEGRSLGMSIKDGTPRFISELTTKRPNSRIFNGDNVKLRSSSKDEWLSLKLGIVYHLLCLIIYVVVAGTAMYL